MVGGEGAKERRRLSRLQQTGGHEGAGALVQKKPGARTTPTQKPTQRNASKKSFDKPRKKPFGTSKGPMTSKAKNVPHKASTPNKKKNKKLQKPKHLKRKLEQSQEDAAREEVRMKLEEFQAKKAQLSKQPSKISTPILGANLEQDFPRTPQQTNNLEEFQTKKAEPSKQPSKISTPKLGANLQQDFPRTPQQANNLNGKKKQAPTMEDEEDSKDDENITPIVNDHEPKGLFDTKEVKSNDNRDEFPTGDDGPSSGNNGTADDSSDDEDEEKQALKRERGRRRRGRKDTAKLIEETKVTEEPPTKKQKIVVKPENENSTASETKERYCLGRKPVTDFAVGQKYPGRVVYIKDFGVFFDIGCHSDAFCHVSRLRDDFVANPHELFHEGDLVDVRVVEIDRRQKRITVSLQSDERAADERASVESRAERKKLRKLKEAKKKHPIHKTKKTESSTVDGVVGDKEGEKVHETISSSPRKIIKPVRVEGPKDPSDPAELKRQRKLARRAARRESEGIEDS